MASYKLGQALESGDISKILMSALPVAKGLGYDVMGGLTGGENADFMAADVAGQLQSGVGIGQVLDTLKQTYGAGAIADAIAGGAGALAELTGLSPEVAAGVVSGAGTGGLNAAITDQDFLEGLVVGGVGGGAGKYVGSLDIGGAGSVWDTVAPEVASKMSKALVLGNTDQLDDILLNAGYTVAGNLAGSEVYKGLAVKPSFDAESGNYQVGNIVYDKGGNPLGFQDSKTGDYTSYEEVATRNGADYEHGGLEYLDNKEARQYSKAAAVGVSTLLKTGSIEDAMLAATPYAAHGAVDDLFDTLGIDTRWDEGAIAEKIASYGVKKERAKNLAEAARTARTGALTAGIADEYRVSNKTASRAAAAKTKEERDDIIAKAKRKKRAELAMSSARKGYAARQAAEAAQQEEDEGMLSPLQEAMLPMPMMDELPALVAESEIV